MAARTTQSGAEVMMRLQSSARATQAGVEVMYKTPSDARITQVGMEVMQGAPKFPPYLVVPQGESQTVNELDGHSSVGSIDAEAIDPGGYLKPLVAALGLVGGPARIIMGFPGMSIADFATMHTMQILAIDRSPAGLMRFHLADPQRFLMKQMWMNGGPAAWLPGDATPAQPVSTAFAPNSQPVSDKNPRYLQGNPIDILLVGCQNELGLGQDRLADPSAWKLYTPGNYATLINPNPYLDVPAALSLRNGQFSGVWLEFKITSAQDGKQWIEDQILKPLGLYWIVTATGALRLKSMKQQASVSPFVLNDDNIIGTPDTERLPIVNVVQVTAGTADGSQGPVYQFADETSDAVFNQQYEDDVSADGFRDGRGAFLLAELLADKVFRRHAGDTAVYTFDAHLSAVTVQVGDFVTLTHRLMLDLQTGLMGLNNVLCEVIERNPDYQNGKVALKCADTRFMKFTKGPYSIAPVGMPVWASASAAQQAEAMFISDSSGQNSDGSPGNTIF